MFFKKAIIFLCVFSTVYTFASLPGLCMKIRIITCTPYYPEKGFGKWLVISNRGHTYLAKCEVKVSVETIYAHGI